MNSTVHDPRTSYPKTSTRRIECQAKRKDQLYQESLSNREFGTSIIVNSQENQNSQDATGSVYSRGYKEFNRFKSHHQTSTNISDRVSHEDSEAKSSEDSNICNRLDPEIRNMPQIQQILTLKESQKRL
jgi:hypothetical protein